MKLILLIAIALPLASLGQSNPEQPEHPKPKKQAKGIGIKAGLNFANVRNTGSVNTNNQTGFMGGVFFSPPSAGLLGYRSELVYSRQGYNFATQSNTGNVNLDYIIMPHLMTINITKFLQLQFGGQVAILLNAKQDSVKTSSTPNPYGGNMMDMYNKFDYGFGGGVEIHPIKGLIIGARLNVSMGNVYKDPSSYMTGGGTGQSPIPKIEAKNNVLQLSAGYIF
jgi:hypothetical protein